MSEASPPGRTCLLTPLGRGAVAVIAGEGEAALATVDAHFQAANRLPVREQQVNRIVFGHWTDGAGREEVVVCRTSASRIEVHCHGGIAAAARILAALAASGCPVTPWSEWLSADPACLIEAEASIALAAASTRRTAAMLLDQLAGALRIEVEGVCRLLDETGALSLEQAKRRIATLLERATLGQHLTQPWVAAIAGRPNVGKSSLLNVLAGYQRAIVFDQPGTTRDVLAVETAIDGWPVRLTDAAGLRTARDPLEAAGVELARQQLGRADLVIWVVDAASLSTAGGAKILESAKREILEEGLEVPERRLLVAVNKTDLFDPGQQREWVGVSAKTGAGIEDLLSAISRRLVPKAPEAGAATPFTSRQADLLGAAADCSAGGDARAACRELERLVGAR
jgi:tRNA modification GTPase